MDTFDNRTDDSEQPRHPLFALEAALVELRLYLRENHGNVIDDDLALKLSIYLDNVEESFLTVKEDVIERIVADHNFRTPSLN